MTSKVLRIGGIVVVVGLLIALIAASFARPSAASSIWDTRTTLGDVNSTNHYIMYTDIMCPYCEVFSRELMNHREEFERDYINGKNILFEVRVTDSLYEHGSKNENSRNGAEAIYCAAEQDRFWDYYQAAIEAVWKDYHSKALSSDKSSPAVVIDREYWQKIANKLSLGDDWAFCYNGHKMIEKIEENTTKATKATNGGVPYFKFNKFTSSGFDTSWGWDRVKDFLDAGLK